MIIITPAIWLNNGKLSIKNFPSAVAVAPRKMKTSEKPRIKNKVLRIIFLRAFDLSLVVSISFSDTPDINDIYPGTIGRTHGEMNDKNPNANAVMRLIFSK